MRVFAVVDGFHLWVSVPFSMLYPVRKQSHQGRQNLLQHAAARPATPQHAQWPGASRGHTSLRLERGLAAAGEGPAIVLAHLVRVTNLSKSSLPRVRSRHRPRPFRSGAPVGRSRTTTQPLTLDYFPCTTCTPVRSVPATTSAESSALESSSSVVVLSCCPERATSSSLPFPCTHSTRTGGTLYARVLLQRAPKPPRRHDAPRWHCCADMKFYFKCWRRRCQRCCLAMRRWCRRGRRWQLQCVHSAAGVAAGAP